MSDPTVSELLTASRSAHEQAKVARLHRKPEARDLLVQARDQRLEAHALDPEHTATDWGQERTTHEAYLLFYAEQLG